MTRQQRIRLGAHADRENQEGRKRGLRQIELRDSLQVAKRLATLDYEERYRVEVAGDKHEVRDAARHLRAAALCDCQPRALQRRYVVDAIAEHRHVAALVGERPHECLLALRGDSSHDRRLHREAPQLEGIVGDRRGGAPAPRDAAARGGSGGRPPPPPPPAPGTPPAAGKGTAGRGPPPRAPPPPPPM